MKTKKDAKTTATSANGQESNELAKSKRSKQAKRQIIIYVVMVVAIVGILGFARDDIDGRIKGEVLKYLRDKYKQEFVVTDYTTTTVNILRAVQGRIGTEYNLANSKCRWLGEDNETYDDCSWSVRPKGNPKGECMVSYSSSGAMWDSCAQVILGKENYAKARQISAEEDRLRPYAERIFGKNTKVGVEFRLCERGEASMKGITGLPQAMSICKEETADMTKEEIIDSSLYNDSGLSHDYSVYIYALDGQSTKTDDDKAKIIKRLKKMVKYLPDGRSDSMWLCYFIKQYKGSGWGSELKVSVDDLRQMTDSFSDDLLKPIVTNDGGTDPYPIRKGWDK